MGVVSARNHALVKPTLLLVYLPTCLWYNFCFTTTALNVYEYRKWEYYFLRNKMINSSLYLNKREAIIVTALSKVSLKCLSLDRRLSNFWCQSCEDYKHIIVWRKEKYIKVYFSGKATLSASNLKYLIEKTL